MRVYAGDRPFQEYRDAALPSEYMSEDFNEDTASHYAMKERMVSLQASFVVLLNAAFVVLVGLAIVRKEGKLPVYIAATLWLALLVFAIVSRNEPLHLRR